MVGAIALLQASSWSLPHGQSRCISRKSATFVDLSQSRDRFVSDLAHELRTPLTSIRLVAETLQDQLEHLCVVGLTACTGVDRLINLVQTWLEQPARSEQ